MTRFALGLLIVALAWGAFAFGAVYPWAWWPLVAALGVITWIGIVAGRSPRSGHLGALAVPLVLAIVAIALQLLPLPLDLVQRISPSTIEAVRALDPLVGNGLVSRHPLSIWPPATRAAIPACLSIALLVIGSARLFSVAGTRQFVERLTLLGVLLALTGIVQRPLYSGRIYGFWKPLEGGNPFGPFVDKDHFAGWMLMALPLTIGLACGAVEHGMRGLKPGVRARILWLGSVDASRLLLLSGAAVVMALSLMLTMARSGIGAFGIALTITSVLIVCRQQTGGRKIAAVAILAGIALVVVATVGADVIARHFAAASWQDLNGRLGAWSDAAATARQFPLAGTGLNTYGVSMNLYQRHNLDFHYRQAHNDYLQLASEGGVLVCLPVLASVLLFVVAVRRRFKDETSVTAYWIRVGAATGLIAIAAQEMVDFSLQMPGNAALFAVLCGIALHQSPERRRVRAALP